MPQRIAAIPGDGVGPEVVAATVPVLQRSLTPYHQSLDVDTLDWGADRFLREGAAMPVDGADILRGYDGVLFGAVGQPSVPDRELVWSLIITLRQQLDLAVNLRPILAFPGVPSSVRDTEGVDFIIVRENTEGEYVGVGGLAHAGTGQDLGLEVAVHSRAAIERAARHACGLAAGRRGRLTLVTKSNAIRHGYPLWDEVVAEVCADYPDVSLDTVLVDAMTARMVQQPRSLDVVLASNLFGDILSDLGAVLAGGMGMAPSANLAADGRTPGIYEPVHGSAPDIAGQGIANPTACILSGALMLDHLGFAPAADDIRAALTDVLSDPDFHTPDIGGTAHTTDISSAVLDRLQNR